MNDYQPHSHRTRRNRRRAVAIAIIICILSFLSTAMAISTQQVLDAAAAGCPASIIGERLKCSPGHVRRIMRAHGISATPNALVGTDDEWRLWLHEKEHGRTFGEVAYRFCVSPQAVQQRLQRVSKKRINRDPVAARTSYEVTHAN